MPRTRARAVATARHGGGAAPARRRRPASGAAWPGRGQGGPAERGRPQGGAGASAQAARGGAKARGDGGSRRRAVAGPFRPWRSKAPAEGGGATTRGARRPRGARRRRAGSRGGGARRAPAAQHGRRGGAAVARRGQCRKGGGKGTGRWSKSRPSSPRLESSGGGPEDGDRRRGGAPARNGTGGRWRRGRFGPGLVRTSTRWGGGGGGRGCAAWGARKSSGAAKNGRDGRRRRLCSAWLVPSARTKTMGRGKRRRNRDWIRATWPREGIERVRAESEDRRRSTRGVAGGRSRYGRHSGETVTQLNDFDSFLTG